MNKPMTVSRAPKGFTFVELLVVIAVIAVLVAASAGYLFAQGGAKARDTERRNDLNQVAALLEQFVSSYGEPPNDSVKNRTLKTRFEDCDGVADYKALMKCFQQVQYLQGDGLVSLTEDPQEGIENDAGNEQRYLYGADNRGYKVCALLENQTDPSLNDDYSGSGQYGDEGHRTYCIVSSNRSQDYIQSVASGGEADFLE